MGEIILNGNLNELFQVMSGLNLTSLDAHNKRFDPDMYLAPLILHHALIVLLRENAGLIGPQPAFFNYFVCYTEQELEIMERDFELLTIVCWLRTPSSKYWNCEPYCKSYNRLVAREKRLSGYACITTDRASYKDGAIAVNCLVSKLQDPVVDVETYRMLRQLGHKQNQAFEISVHGDPSTVKAYKEADIPHVIGFTYMDAVHGPPGDAQEEMLVKVEEEIYSHFFNTVSFYKERLFSIY